MSQTIIVSNRLPVSIKKGEKGLGVYPSAGGLATGLASYANKKGNLWIGWPGIVSDDLTEKEKYEVVAKLAVYNCSPVFLSKKQINEFYNGYSNSVLWPFFHTLEADLTHQDRQWKAYRQVNQLFADAVLTVSELGSTVWVHDYQLVLLPKLLREHRPTDHIGFFLHIPFPAAQHFSTLSQAPSLIRGMLGADLVGFHTNSYAENFLASVNLLTSATIIDGGLTRNGHVIRIADFPMGIDYVKFRDAIQAKAVQAELRRLKARYLGKKIILTVDRLDPTKGFIERLEAYRTLLSENPQLHKKVIMLMLAVCLPLPALRKHAKQAPGAVVEEKDCSVVWHFRNATPYAAQKQVAIIKTAFRPFLKTYGLKLFMGNKIIEIKDPDITKGKTVKALLTKPYDFILAIGDDYTDEDMFKALPKHGFSIKVGPGKTTARYRLKNTQQIADLLDEL